MYRTASRLGMVLLFLAVMTLPASFETRASADAAGNIVAGILGGALLYELLKPDNSYPVTPYYGYYGSPYYGTPYYGPPYYGPPVVVVPPTPRVYGGLGRDWDDHAFWRGGRDRDDWQRGYRGGGWSQPQRGGRW